MRHFGALMANVLAHQLPAPAEVPYNFSSSVLSCYWVKCSYPQSSVWRIVWGRYLEQANAKNQYLLSLEEWQSSVNMPTRAGPDNNFSLMFHMRRTHWCQWRISDMCSNESTMANAFLLIISTVDSFIFPPFVFQKNTAHCPRHDWAEGFLHVVL